MTRRALLVLLALAFAGAPVTRAAAQDAGALEVEGTHRYPLEPPDTSSPRATFQSFLSDANAAWRTYLRREQAPDQESERPVRYVRRAARCLDLSQVPPAQRDEIATQTVVLLLDVFNRIPFPSAQSLPDAAAMERAGSTRYTLPHTGITIERMAEGPRAGEWLFTSQVVDGAKEFYRRTRELPLKPGAVVQDGFEIYVALTGWMIPAGWIEALPEWAQNVYFEQTVWQWVLLVVLFVVVFLLARLVFRWAGRAPPGERHAAWRLMAGPVALMLLSWFALDMVDVQLNITGELFGVLQTLLSLALYLGTAWAVMRAGRILADAIVASPRFAAGGVDAQLVHMVTRLLALGVAIAILVEGARSQGIPVVGVLAGLGVGGLAVALAAQSTIENFIGSLTLFADRPVRVGDFCRFGSQLGTVEQIGLRSTQIRTLDRSILTVPNAEFSRLQIDNLTRRDRILFRATLNLRLETTAEQLQRVLSRVRELLLADERVDDEPARIRLVTLGPYSLDLEIFAYVRTSDWNTFLGIREELLLAILHEVEEAGTALAPPAQTSYLRAPEEPDEASPDG